jgi:hypothetical protein
MDSTCLATAANMLELNQVIVSLIATQLKSRNSWGLSKLNQSEVSANAEQL